MIYNKIYYFLHFLYFIFAKISIKKFFVLLKYICEYISSNNVNVVFLDIEFSGCKENGLDIAKKIRKINKNCYLIFVTSHFEYIVNAYKFKTFDYIFKSSIDIENISSTLKRLFDDIYDSDAKFLIFQIFHMLII